MKFLVAFLLLAACAVALDYEDFYCSEGAGSHYIYYYKYWGLANSKYFYIYNGGDYQNLYFYFNDVDELVSYYGYLYLRYRFYEYNGTCDTENCGNTLWWPSWTIDADNSLCPASTGGTGDPNLHATSALISDEGYSVIVDWDIEETTRHTPVDWTFNALAADGNIEADLALGLELNIYWYNSETIGWYGEEECDNEDEEGFANGKWCWVLVDNEDMGFYLGWADAVMVGTTEKEIVDIVFSDPDSTSTYNQTYGYFKLGEVGDGIDEESTMTWQVQVMMNSGSALVPSIMMLLAALFVLL